MLMRKQQRPILPHITLRLAPALDAVAGQVAEHMTPLDHFQETAPLRRPNRNHVAVVRFVFEGAPRDELAAFQKLAGYVAIMEAPLSVHAGLRGLARN